MTSQKIDKKIKHARIAAMISGIITFAGAITLINKQTELQFSLFNMLSLVDAFIIFGMAYGIYKKSRLCAVLMFEYFLFSKLFILSISSQTNLGTIIVGSIFLYFLFQGVSGTFAYHKYNTLGKGKASSIPFGWISAGSCCLILYIFVLPTLLV
jgi:serine/threonine-protein kinase